VREIEESRARCVDDAALALVGSEEAGRAAISVWAELVRIDGAVQRERAGERQGADAVAGLPVGRAAAPAEQGQEEQREDQRGSKSGLARGTSHDTSVSLASPPGRVYRGDACRH
jgi:hypothetical protein